MALSSLQVRPDSVQWSASMIFMVIVGGVGTMEGPIIGAMVFFALQQWFAQYSTVYLIVLIVLNVVAIGVVPFAPKGLWASSATTDDGQVSRSAIEFDLRMSPWREGLRKPHQA